MRKVLLSALMGTALFLAPAHAEVVVHTKPPHAVSERPPAPPGPGYMWINGYQQWDGSKFVWQPGHWQKPPREHAIWMGARWEKTPQGYVFIDGWWAG
jgi:hypothetical protein